ncbi:MAG: DUF2911 domain-containing protein [Gemmatimonadales bacterium]
MRGSAASLLAAALVTAGPAALAGQVRASERSTVSQTVDGTVFTINYARPQVRGRTAIFGREVRWGEVWTPGANWATTLEVNRDVTLDGHRVPKGKYSVWFTVTQGDWTVILDPRHLRYHTEHPDSTAAQIRWTIRPESGGAVEILTWSFPEVRPDGAILRFEWADRSVTLAAQVQPSHPIPIAEAEVAPYLGKWEWRWADDTTSVIGMELYYRDGMLLQRYTPFPSWYPTLQDQPMVRINDDWFIPTIIRNGRILEMVADMVFEFTRVNGRPMSFEVRDDTDALLGSGRRVP